MNFLPNASNVLNDDGNDNNLQITQFQHPAYFMLPQMPAYDIVIILMFLQCLFFRRQTLHLDLSFLLFLKSSILTFHVSSYFPAFTDFSGAQFFCLPLQHAATDKLTTQRSNPIVFALPLYFELDSTVSLL